MDLPVTHRADVVIVGGGGAGMSAAISAADADDSADVLLVQKLDELDGATTMAMGSFSAAGTALQAAQDVPDSTDAHFDDIDHCISNARASGRYRGEAYDERSDPRDYDDLELRRLLVEEAATTLEWLRDLGCEYAGPYLDPPNRVPRLHQVQPDTSAYGDVLGDELADRSVEVLYRTEAYELIEEEDRIVGVLADRADRRTPFIIEADEGVVLATGDLVHDDGLRGRHVEDARAEGINHHNTGDGHEFAADVGARLVNMDVQLLAFRLGDPLYTGPVVPSLVEAGAIMTNRAGHRFVDETARYDQLFDAALEQPNGVAYLAFDDDVARQFTEWPDKLSTYGKEGKPFAYLDEYLETDFLSRGETLAAAASGTGVDAGGLEETVAEYNGGIDDPNHETTIDRFGRRRRSTLDADPYYVFGPMHTNAVLTDGGVDVDTDLRVLDEEGTPIDGLYAAGAVAGGLLLAGHGHHHSWLFTSGRLAGRSVLE